MPSKYTKYLKKKQRMNKTKKGGLWPFSSKKKDNKDETKMPETPSEEKTVNIFLSDKISMQSIPNNYIQIGILHLTDSAAINAIRDIGTGFFNAFGSKGFDNIIYDNLRKTVFDKVKDTLVNEQKVFNVRLDFEGNTQGTTIFLHLYGDLCEPIPDKTQNHLENNPVGQTDSPLITSESENENENKNE
jgi:hypothetical protein